MCEVAVISPEGQRWLMVLCAEQLRFMIVRCFVEEVLKMLVAQNRPFPGYTKDDVKLHIGGKSVDDECAPVTKYGIKPGSVVQLVRKVHGG